MSESTELQSKTEASVQRPDFEIGLALAGAISAGAYTAGVIDFLMQSLQEWEKERAEGAPAHRVQLRTIAGASAGAVAGALSVVAMRRGLMPVEFPVEEAATMRGMHGTASQFPDAFQRIRCVLPSLYDAWVVRPRMVAAEGSKAKDFLGLDDVNADTPVRVRSLLNGLLLDEIAEAALSCPPAQQPPAPTDGFLSCSFGPFPFLSEAMHVFVTVTNLRGIPFDVHFGADKYGMLTHGDRLHYLIKNIGTAEDPKYWPEGAFLNLDTKIEIDGNALPSNRMENISSDWLAYGQGAIASAAFPIGLSPRVITTPFAQYASGQRQYPLPSKYGMISANFPKTCDVNGDFRFLSVDGGVVNNNPFDFVEAALWDFGQQRKTGKDADRAVIMVAPFPEPPTFLGEDQPQAELVSVLKALYPALINQARFRPAELGAAIQKDDRSRFLISPTRSLTAEQPDRYPIACGLLGGFGGFLDESFRAHDYQLGRRNCQHFLASIFCLPSSNKAMQAGGLHVPAVERPDAYDVAGSEFMIVPLCGEALREVGLPPWPRMSGEDFRVLLKRIGGRFDNIVKPLIESQTDKPSVRKLLRLAVWSSHERIMKYIETTILSDLVRRDQIAGWELPASVLGAASQNGGNADDVREILANLVAGATGKNLDYATLVSSTRLAPDLVHDVLVALQRTSSDQPFHVIRKGQDKNSTYLLQLNMPTGIRTLPLIGGYIERWLPEPYRYN